MVEQLKQERFDFALVDLHMPNCDGLTATRLYRQFEAEQRLSKSAEEIRPPLVIVGLTGDQRAETESECLEAGMNGILYKPFTPESLTRQLASFKFS
jgi:CheY-like chemotaxis protein